MRIKSLFFRSKWIVQGTPPCQQGYLSLSPAAREGSWSPMEIYLHISMAISSMTKILIIFPHSSILTLFFLKLQQKQDRPLLQDGGPMSMDEENGRTQWAEVKSASVGRYDVSSQYRDIVIFTMDGPRAGFGPFLAVRCAGDDTQSCPVPLEDVMDGVEVMDG